LKVPYYVVIGNHEVFKSQHFDKKEYMKIVSKYSKNCRSKSPNYVFKKKGVVFVVVDGAKEVIPGPAGYYKQSTLKWLDKTLTKYKNDKVVLLQHFPIVEPYFNRSHTTYNVADYQAVLKKHSNVIAIFSGHYHANGENMVDGIYHVSTPALVVPPHNYKVVEISNKNKKDCQIYTQLRHAE
jgi:3',5'-cyclic AMP phosphodiesterase CpdA